MGDDGGSGRLHRHATPAHRPEPLAGEHVLRGERGLKDLGLPLSLLHATSTMATHPAPDHHASPVVPAATAAAGVEPLGHAAQLGAPGDVLLEALLRLLRDADPVAARLLPEASDPARRRALLLLGRGADVDLRQVADDHDLVVLDGDFYSREPAVREPSGKPTFDRTELFLIHALHNYTVINQMSRPTSPLDGFALDLRGKRGGEALVS